MADETLQSNVQKRCTLSKFYYGIKAYQENMTAGKVLLCPQEVDEVLAKHADDINGEIFEIKKF